MSDEDERLVNARGAVTAPPVAEADDLVAREVTTQRRHPSRPHITCAAAVLVLAVVVAFFEHRQDSRTTPPAASDYSALVLRDGDTVRASGRVVAVPGWPVEMCDPNQVIAGVGQTGPEPIERCGSDTSVVVTGVDLDRLAGRRSLNGAVTGTATLTGTYRNGTIAVTAQQATPITQTPRVNDNQVPCTAPAGGWPAGDQESLNMLDDVYTYARQHPGAIITEAFMQPTPTAAIAYVLTAGDPAPVRAALAKTYGTRLCVSRSRYTQAQIDAAKNAINIESSDGRAAGVTGVGSGGLSGDAQPEISVDLRQLTPEIVRQATKQPAGLIRFNIWLIPEH